MIRLFTSAFVAAFLLNAPALALTEEERAARRAEIQGMSPDERRAARDARRAELEAMSPEERSATRDDRRAQARERTANMSDEERAALRERRGAKGRGERRRGVGGQRRRPSGGQGRGRAR